MIGWVSYRVVKRASQSKAPRYTGTKQISDKTEEEIQLENIIVFWMIVTGLLIFTSIIIATSVFHLWDGECTGPKLWMASTEDVHKPNADLNEWSRKCG